MIVKRDRFKKCRGSDARPCRSRLTVPTTKALDVCLILVGSLENPPKDMLPTRVLAETRSTASKPEWAIAVMVNSGLRVCTVCRSFCGLPENPLALATTLAAQQQLNLCQSPASGAGLTGHAIRHG